MFKPRPHTKGDVTDGKGLPRLKTTVAVYSYFLWRTTYTFRKIQLKKKSFQEQRDETIHLKCIYWSIEEEFQICPLYHLNMPSRFVHESPVHEQHRCLRPKQQGEKTKNNKSFVLFHRSYKLRTSWRGAAKLQQSKCRSYKCRLFGWVCDWLLMDLCQPRILN